MTDELRYSTNPWMNVAEKSSRMVIVEGIEASGISRPRSLQLGASADGKLGFHERALSAAGAAFLSAILVNPLDVAELHECMRKALGAMEPETFLSLLPLDLEAQDLSESNLWLFPILKQYTVGAHLNFFTKSIHQ